MAVALKGLNIFFQEFVISVFENWEVVWFHQNIILCMLLCVRIKDRCTRVKKKVLIESRDLEEFVQL